MGRFLVFLFGFLLLVGLLAFYQKPIQAVWGECLSCTKSRCCGDDCNNYVGGYFCNNLGYGLCYCDQDRQRAPPTATPRPRPPGPTQPGGGGDGGGGGPTPMALIALGGAGLSPGRKHPGSFREPLRAIFRPRKGLGRWSPTVDLGQRAVTGGLRRYRWHHG